jgi:hypothetical protein
MTTFLVTVFTLAAGAIIAYYIGYRSKEPMWCIRTSTLLRNSIHSHKNLSILFDNKEVTTLSVSRIAIWNHGKKVINNMMDKIAGEELKIVPSKKTKILETSIIANNNQTQGNKNISGFEIRETEDHMIEFDTMEKNHGCVIQVIHTGAGSKDIKIRGKFKDSKELKNIFYNKKMFLKEETYDFDDQEAASIHEPHDFVMSFSLYYPLITLLSVGIVFLNTTIFLYEPMIQLPSFLKFLYPGPNPLIQFTTNYVIQRNLEKVLYPIFSVLSFLATYFWAKISGILTRRLIPRELLNHI